MVSLSVFELKIQINKSMQINKYSNAYFKIIEQAKQRNSGNEKHHILPKSMGGSNCADNIVKLTYKEHYVCHHLLTKCTSGIANDKMTFAFSFMIETRGQRVTARVYGNTKAKVRLLISKANTGRVRSEEHKRIISEANKGRPTSALQKQRSSEVHKGKIMSKETRKKLSDCNIGRRASDATKAKMSASAAERMQRNGNPMSGKRHTDRTRQLMSEQRTGKSSHWFAGYYVTPWGKFASHSEAIAAAPMPINATSFRRWCKENNNTQIRNQSYRQNKYLNSLGEHVVGKTFKEMGFGYEEET